MAEAVLFNIAQEVLKNLGVKALDKIAATWGFKDRLQQLKNTINTIKDVLLDAEERQADSHAVRGWLERLTTVIYAADDLFDEVVTVASRKQLMGGNKLTKEVRIFFSNSNQIAFALNISQKMKKIRQELDEIVKNSTEFAFVLRPHEEGKVISTRRVETYSFVDSERVVGRDGDKKAILDMLLASSSINDGQKKHPVIPIVGIGGLGKTTLAQLIYNDPEVYKFFELRLWVCVSDVFDVKEIVEQILASATNTGAPKLNMEQLQGRLRNEVGGKKFLLVLDDVWNENREKWVELRDLLNIGRNGSTILITTRSKEVAKIMGTIPPHELGGLSEEESWELFEKTAFEPGLAQKKPDLVNLGKEMVKKCANVPLAIRTLGSLLYGKDERKWLSLKDMSLAKMSENQTDIIHILKLSYDHLWSPLKHCFAYCSLFPKGHEFDKEMLIDLWMAEGFIIQDVGNMSQSLEELGEEYFLTLLQRGFFQDITRNEWGDIKSCKMHDLMHDLAQKMGGDKCKVVKLDGTPSYDDKTRHLSIYNLDSQLKISNEILNLNHLRTFLLLQHYRDWSNSMELVCQQVISSFSSLRVLDLQGFGIKTLPSSLGELVHLRYLDLSKNDIEELSDSITKLHNLQTLRLYDCYALKTLPKKIRKLVNLRSLDVGYSLYNLSHLPSGIGELILLHKLPLFIVNHDHCRKLEYKPTNTAKLSELKKLNNLRGALDIIIYGEITETMFEATEANLSCKHGLTQLFIKLDTTPPEGDTICHNHDEFLLEGLKPPPNLRELRIEFYMGRKLPSWAAMDNLCITFSKLVKIDLQDWTYCQNLPNFSQLPFLRSLQLSSFPSVEFLEMDNGSYEFSSSMKKTPFFRALEELQLYHMDNLKGWWKGPKGESINTDDDYQSFLSFPKLSELTVYNCPNLNRMPRCPNIENIKLGKTSKNISMLKMVLPSSKLKRLETDSIEDLRFVPKQCLCHLSTLVLHGDEIVSTDGLGEVFATLSPSLRSLRFESCQRLRSFSKGLEHLTMVEYLALSMCEQLDLSMNRQRREEDEEKEEEVELSTVEEDDEDTMPWKAFKHNLLSLTLEFLDKLVSLPSGIRHLQKLRNLSLSFISELKELPECLGCLSSLEKLVLAHCPKLTFLPDNFRNLTSLNELIIYQCRGLRETCRAPNGRDWPKIQHIPLFHLE